MTQRRTCHWPSYLSISFLGDPEATAASRVESYDVRRECIPGAYS